MTYLRVVELLGPWREMPGAPSRPSFFHFPFSFFQILSTPAPTALGSAPGYYLNVGLFAEEANARRAQAKLLNVGLPAFRQTFSTKNGERSRVRVGPFASEADAQKAATQIRSLQLDALMYRQRG